MIMALYMRLSKEDDEVVDESNSITNQRYILRRYIERMPELSHYRIVEYVDDGYSGKNFERPGIGRLLEEVKSGKIYGILVKDFSRFGRNHIEVGNYIEKIFPLLDVRFIAVNNHFDSADYMGTTPDMDVAFENLMYDYFSEENSIKIKSDLFHKRMRGKYMATFAPYGYKKSPEDLPPLEWETRDNNHEGIIRNKHFEWINSKNFKASNYLEKKKPEKDSAISYEGAAKKDCTVSDQGTKKYDSVVYCEGEKRKRGDKDSPIKGIVKCGGCRHHMIRRNRRNASYYCRHYYEIKDSGCCSENVKETELMEIVREAICRQAALFADRKELSRLYRDVAKQQKEKTAKEQEFLRNKIQTCKNENFILYEQYKKEEIDRCKFQEQRQKNLRMLEAYQQQLGQYARDDEETDVDRSGILSLLEGKENLSELTKEIVEQLVSAIYVNGNGQVEIVFRIKDELESFLESTNNSMVQKNI